MNTNEKQFEMPNAVVVVFETEDVITTSVTGGGFEPGDGEGGESIEP